jgi:two-component system OmpR family response regulator
MPSVRLLVAEDDLRLARTLRRGLNEAGFSVDLVARGDDALAAAAITPFDLILLDVMLPGKDGIEVCTQLRRGGVHTPILMLTGRDAIADRIRGLDAGADDYMVKPFAFGELLARLRALGRRHLPARSAIIELAGIRLDTAARTVTVGPRQVSLRNKEFAMLEYFMHHPGRLLTRTQLEEHVWSYDFSAESNLVEAYISRLRRKLTDAGGSDPFTTVRGSGYRFEASR